MFSTTEERLRNFIEKLSEALTNEVKVEVKPGDSWAAYPKRNPPLLTFRLADVAVIKDEILSVTAHEIAHLLYTDPEAAVPFEVGKFPKAAHLLLNAVEDSRIERIFTDEFPGARSLFDARVDDAYDGKVQRGFEDLPIKWRFILNIDRVLHGLEPWGDDRDLKAIEGAFDSVIAAMWTDETQECADLLEPAFRIMVELIKLEKEEKDGVVPKHLDIPDAVQQAALEQQQAQQPDDYIANHPGDDQDPDAPGSGQQSDNAGAGAPHDDGKPGGTDGTPGQRQGGKGAGKQTSGQEQGKGGKGGSGGTDGAGTNLDYGDFGDPNDPNLQGDDTSSGGGSPGQGDKATNIIEEMVTEEKGHGSTNKTIDILSYRQRQRAQQAKEIEKQIKAEKDGFWDELSELFGRTGRSSKLSARLEENHKRYMRDKAALSVEIRTLRGYARQILRDNQTDRYGGNHTSGRRIKTHRLYRFNNGDMRLFERQEEIGGKSYAICVVVDQSGSMRGANKQTLAYLASLVFLEAFNGIAETSLVGFSECGGDDAYAQLGAGRGYDRRMQMRTHDLYYARTYKDHESPLDRRSMVVPELAISYNTTPMAEGIARAIAELESAPQDVKAMVVITDGQPNDPDAAKREFVKAKRLGIETYALHIEGRKNAVIDSNLPPGLVYLGEACDRVVEVGTTAEIPQAVNRLLRGVVRRSRSVV